MYMKDLTHKMTLRLNDELQDYIVSMSNKYSVSPSDFIRQCIAQNKDARESAERAIEKLSESLKEGFENGIDRKTDKHNLV